MRDHVFAAFTSKPFTFLWLSEVFTQVAVNIFNFYLLLSVFKITNSNTAVAGVVLAYTIPQILFGILAGIYVDQKDKKSILFASNILRAILLIFLAFFQNNLFIIYFVCFLFSVVTQFFIPAEAPMIPKTVPRKMLLSANALFGMGIYGSILAAYILSGPLIILFGQVQALIVIAMLLLVGSLFIYFITVPHIRARRRSIKPVETAIRSELKKITSFFNYSKQVRSAIFLLALSQSMVLIISVIAPGYANQVLNINVEDFPLLFVAPAAFGVVVGAISLVHVFHNYSKNKITTFGLLLSGIAMLILPYGSKIASRDIILTINQSLPDLLHINVIHIIVIIAFVLGLANALVFVPANTVLQEKTVDEQRGKIYGLLNTIVGILSLLPVILVGGLSDLVGVTKVVIGIGVSLLVFALGRVVFKF